MSSLATAARSAAPGSSRATGGTRVDRRPIGVDVLLGLTLAAGLVAVALITAGGTQLGPNTWVEMTLTVLGAALAGWALLRGAPGSAWGAGTLVLLLAVGALTFVSISWSVQPADSWLEANRTLAYVAAFSGALALGRLAPERWPALVGAIAVAATVVSGYALLVKVFPGTFDSSDLIGRLRAPFGYWNATGLMSALGLLPCLWAGARRAPGRMLRALSVPALAILVSVLVLSYSRGALLVALIGLACWFALVPLRLRAALVLALGSAGGGAIALWALSTRPFTHDLVSLESRTTAGHAFGLVLMLALGLLTLAGLACAFAMDRFVLGAEARRRAGITLVSLVALAPVVGIVALATSSRGLTGQVSHAWSTLTNPNLGASDTPGRLVQLGNSRPRYWSEGLKVGEHALLDGVGALGYATARTRYVHDSWIVRHAHSYVIETFADFGLIGLAINLALMLAWVRSAARAVGARVRLPWREETQPITPVASEHLDERAGLLTLLVVVVIFGLHSAIDWTWFVPGTTVLALVSAGWLAGRGPLAKPVGRTPRRKSVHAAPGAYAAVLAIAAAAILGAWGIWQPLRSANADAASIAALNSGNTGAALADARSAVARDPVSVEPLWELAAIYTALADTRQAHDQLLRAITAQPQNGATWRHLGEFDLQRNQPLRALGALRVALRFDPSSGATLSDIAQAGAQLKALSARSGR